MLFFFNQKLTLAQPHVLSHKVLHHTTRKRIYDTPYAFWTLRLPSATRACSYTDGHSLSLASTPDNSPATATIYVRCCIAVVLHSLYQKKNLVFGIFQIHPINNTLSRTAGAYGVATLWVAGPLELDAQPEARVSVSRSDFGVARLGARSLWRRFIMRGRVCCGLSPRWIRLPVSWCLHRWYDKALINN